MVANETWDASLVGIVSSSIISIQTCEISQNTAPEILRNAGKLIGYNMFLFQVCYFYDGIARIAQPSTDLVHPDFDGFCFSA